jgi:dihydroorotate dehydrogenase
MLYSLTKNILFKFDPEQMHNLAIDCMAMAPDVFRSLYSAKNQLDLSVNLNGLVWKSPIGLAAGLDKNGRAISALAHIGFGAIEIGTVTNAPQLGNATPRIFRYPAEHSLRNSMGFPNEGAAAILQRVKNGSYSNIHNCSIGVNLGKNKDVSDEQAIFDQAKMAQEFAPYCDYLVVNISSPNTRGLRDWQHQDKLQLLLSEITNKIKNTVTKPLFIKISPDLTLHDLTSVVEVAKSNHLHGIIATNTTIVPERGPGGISGELLAEKASRIRNHLLDLTRESQLSVIGVGGISNAKQIMDFLINGGDAVQIYSALVFQGPGLIRRLNKELCQIIGKDQSKDLKHYLSKRRRLKWS